MPTLKKVSRKKQTATQPGLPTLPVYEPLNCARIREDDDYRNALRFRAQTDLFWLAYELLGYTRVSEEYHRAVADHYVQKDPRKPIEDQDDIKRRLHLDPRGAYKSTWNMADTVQWIICFPDCAILLLSASSALTRGFVAEVTRHFTLARFATATPFQELFPEFCIPPSAVLLGSYSAPNRTTFRKEQTLMSSSIESSLSGWHYDVLKEDDIHDNRNTETSTSIAKVKKNRHINKKMLMPWGYRDTAGTRYDTFDAYGEDIATARPGELKVLVRPGLRILQGSRYEAELGIRLSPDRFPEPDECTIVFPLLLSYDFLRTDYEADYSAFMTQYMNDAYGGKEVVFDADAIKASIIPDTGIPVTGDALIAWRFACPTVPGMQYAGATVGRVDRGRTFLIDNVRGIFTPTSLASRVVSLAKRHYTHRIEIELTPGAAHFERHIANAMVEQSWHLEVAWLEYEQDEGARSLRLRSIEPLFHSKRLYLSADLPHLRDMQRQLSAFGMVEENELIDTAARITDHMESSIELVQSKQAGEEQLKEWVERDRYDRLYGLGHRVMETAGMEVIEVYEDEPESEVESTGSGICPGLGI